MTHDLTVRVVRPDMVDLRDGDIVLTEAFLRAFPWDTTFMDTVRDVHNRSPVRVWIAVNDPRTAWANHVAAVLPLRLVELADLVTLEYDGQVEYIKRRGRPGE